jgi:hypothetical protein
MPGELPQFYMFPNSHGKYFFLQQTRKKGGNKKRVVYIRKVSLSFVYSCVVLLRFRNTLRLTPSSAPPS